MERFSSRSNSPAATNSDSQGTSGPLSCIGKNLDALRSDIFYFLAPPTGVSSESLSEVGIWNHEYLLVFRNEKFHRPFRLNKDRNSLVYMLSLWLSRPRQAKRNESRRLISWLRRYYPGRKEIEEEHVEDEEDEEDEENRENAEDAEEAGLVGWEYRRKIIKWTSPARLNLTVEELFSRCPEELETETQRTEYDTWLFENDGTEPDKVGEVVYASALSLLNFNLRHLPVIGTWQFTIPCSAPR